MEWSAFELHLRHLPEHEHKRVRKAYDLARKLHDGQKRKSGEPYFIHPVAVALKLARVGADTETIIAALLHDTVEDTPITLEEIEKEFGETVTRLINGVTKLSAADIGTAPNMNEQTETLRKIRSHAARSTHHGHQTLRSSPQHGNDRIFECTKAARTRRRNI